MSHPVIAIGLDSVDPLLLETWIAQGHLPTLRRLQERGMYGRLTTVDRYKAETPWTVFLTGVLPEQSGYWGGIHFLDGSYQIEDVGAYDFVEYPPFYALGDDYRVAVFDVPKTRMSDRVNGVQVIAWGAHTPGHPSCSKPAQVLDDLRSRYGLHPALHKDHGDWWDHAYLTRIHAALKTGISRRASICREFLQQERWDLFLTVFSESHSASHDFWFLSQPEHPLHQAWMAKRFSTDPLRDIFAAVDRALGQILEVAPDQANIVIFSTHGSGSNTTDVPSMFLLGELLYRLNFPGKMMLAAGAPHTPPPPPVLSPKRKTWTGDLLRFRDDPNPLRRWLRRSLPGQLHPSITRFLGSAHKPDLASPEQLQMQGDPFFWQPVSWYRPFWPQMKAFALPSYSEGYIRINLQGREPAGIVVPSEYDALCQELTTHLYALRNPRTGTPVVQDVVRTRRHGEDLDPKLPGADLVVQWSEPPADVIESPAIGRIGPVPYRRTGSHRARGFVLFYGPDIAPGPRLSQAHALDLAPTILNLMGAPIPTHFTGVSLVDKLLRA